MVGKRLVPVSAIALFAGPAAATGGFWCTVDDENATFSVQGGLAHGIPGGPFSFSGELTVKLDAAPADFRSLKLDDTLIQSWIVGPDLRVQMYRERDGEPFAAIELTLVTAQDADDEMTYVGEYRLALSELKPGDSEQTVVEASGPVSCGVE